MAANFSSAEDICEGENCEAITDVTYYVKEKKKLCEGCIGKARKGVSYLYCEKHDEEIKEYCTTHGVAVCHSCAMIYHNELSCVRQDIDSAIIENRAKLNILKEKAKDKLKLCQVHGDHILQCRKDTDTHMRALKHEVDSLVNEAIQADKGIEKEDAAKINQEIDEKNQHLQEEIRKINEKIRKNDEERQKRLELNRKNAEKRREPIGKKQHGLHTYIHIINEEKNKKIAELEKSWQDETKSTEKTIQTLDTVLQHDKNVVNDGHHVNTSANGMLKKPLNEGEVKQITGTISGVRFVKGAGREYDGRIDGYDGEWKLINTINVSDKISFPVIVGCIDECNVILTALGIRSTHVLDMNNKHTGRVITGSDTPWVVSCALLNDDKVVCGKRCGGCTGDSLPGCISVYDRQWKHINDVTIPRNTTSDGTRVDVAVDQDGMIIAAEAGQSKIYVINPADGKIMNTITCKQNIRMRGVLSSGHIIARPSPLDHSVFIIDRQGAQREIPHSDVIMNACIDPMTDDLYVMTLDDEYKTCVVDQVMSGGDMKNRRVASFPLLTKLEEKKGYLLSSCLSMTSSGKLIACDGDNILVFKNRSTL